MKRQKRQKITIVQNIVQNIVRNTVKRFNRWKRLHTSEEEKIFTEHLPGSIQKPIKKPVVSLLMPALNAERFLAQAIESVIRQSYPSWELLIIDDRSIDKTLQIAESYAEQDSRIKVLKNLSQKGISHSRNKALQAAQGTFIGHLDADDWLVPHALKTMLAAFGHHTALVYSGYIMTDKQGQSPEKFLAIPFDRKKIADIGWQHFGMYRKKAALAVGGHNLKLITCSDGDLFVRIAQKYPVKRVPAYLYYYRWHDTNTGHTRPHCLDCPKQNVCAYFKEWNREVETPKTPGTKTPDTSRRSRPWRSSGHPSGSS